VTTFFVVMTVILAGIVISDVRTIRRLLRMVTVANNLTDDVLKQRDELAEGIARFTTSQPICPVCGLPCWRCNAPEGEREKA
jgi:hypothetical protein